METAPHRKAMSDFKRWRRRSEGTRPPCDLPAANSDSTGGKSRSGGDALSVLRVGLKELLRQMLQVTLPRLAAGGERRRPDAGSSPGRRRHLSITREAKLWILSS